MIKILLTEKISVKVTGKKLKYYLNLGYDCKVNEIITINIQHLSEGSNYKIECLCDYCLEKGIETVVTKEYYKYLKERKYIEKDSCVNCAIQKKEEINLIKLGVKHHSQIPEIAEKVAKKRRLSFDFVKSEFEKLEYILLETEYKNANTKMKYICKKHLDEGEQFTTYARVKRGSSCRYCGIETNGKHKRIDINIAKEKCIEKDFKYVDFRYKNKKLYVIFICNKHINLGNQMMSWINLSKCKGCKQCANEHVNDNRKLTYDFVNEQFELKGLKLIDTKYINSQTKMKYICLKHPEKIQAMTYSSLSTGQGCAICHMENIRGEGHWNWKGGISSLQSFLRDKLTDWKKDSMKNCDYECVITGDKFDDIHHLYSFHMILEESLNELGLNIRSNVSDYTDDELHIIENKMIELHHKYPLGVCLRGDIHKLFHQIYGKSNNTPEQFYKFKDNYINNKLFITAI